MTSLETIGNAQLLAAEGQRQIASVVARALHRLATRIAHALARYSPPSDAML